MLTHICVKNLLDCSLLPPEEEIIVQDGHIKGMKKMDLGFNGFRMELKAKKKSKTNRLILDGSIRGRARPGRMLAIMGPSGESHFC